MSFYDKYTIILCSTAAIAYFVTGYYVGLQGVRV
jgi:hypothetical protein